MPHSGQGGGCALQGSPAWLLMQAGSDSLLTASTFLRLKDTCFAGFDAVAKHKGILYGLGADGNNELISGPTDGS